MVTRTYHQIQVANRIKDIAADIETILTDEEIEGMKRLHYENLDRKSCSAYQKIRNLAIEKYDIDVSVLWELVRQLRVK